MGLPKKNITTTQGKIKAIPEYLTLDNNKVIELMQKAKSKTTFFPKTIKLEDTDFAAYEFIKTEKLKLIIDGKAIPVIYLDNERWGEFSKTWNYVDEDKNLVPPFITIRRIGVAKGTRLEVKHRIPSPHLFTYFDIPFLDDGVVINYKVKVPQPVNVDLTYDVRLFSKYTVDMNKYNEQVLRVFASFQEYVYIEGQPFPIVLDEITDENQIDIDVDKFMVTAYKMTIKSIIQTQDEFEVVKTMRPLKLKFGI